VSEYVPLTIREIPTGTQVFDWIIPEEWNVRNAYIKDSAGRRVVEFKKNNLHLVSYSMPVRETLSLEELKAHLGSLIERRITEALEPEKYEVVIDSTLEEGSLTYGEYLLPGKSKEEVIFLPTPAIPHCVTTIYRVSLCSPIWRDTLPSVRRCVTLIDSSLHRRP
jgi:aminopeptidase-like protein